MSIVDFLSVNFLNNDYNHTIDFDDVTSQTSFFDNYLALRQELPTTDDYVYVRENKVIMADANKSTLDGVNYLRFTNNGTKWWYAFIISKEYVNENTTRVIFEIDVMQTFMFDYTLKESFISRQHEDRWNSSDNPIFNIKPEDIDLGNSYVKTSDDLIIDSGNNDYKVKCALIVCNKAIDGTTIFNKTGSFGPAQGSADPLFYYLLPIVNYPEFWIYNSDESKRFMSVRQLVYDMSRTDQASGGSSFQAQKQAYANIVSISILPYMPVNYTLTINNSHKIINVPSLTTAPLYLYDDTEVLIYKIDSTIARTQLATINFKTKLNIPAPVKTLGTAKSQAQETKLYTAPYTYITLDDNQANPLRIEPQFIDNLSTNIKINQTLSDTPITMYYIDGYKGDSGNDDVLVNNNVNNLTIAVDKLSDYLNERRASATTGLATNLMLDTTTNIVRTAIGVALDNPFAISNAISGVSSSISKVLNEMQHRTDLRLGPVNVKDRGNNVYSYLQKYMTNTGLHIKKYDIASAFKQVAYELFYHYGYACRDFLVPNVRSRYYFNYIQSPDMCIDTTIDNEYINKIKSIFRDGITIWHYRDSNTWQGIENYDYENVEMNLLGV